MRYEDIKALVERYGEDYLSQGDIRTIFNIIKDSPSMQNALEQGITPEWIELLKQRGKIYVYTDYRKPSVLDTSKKAYPFMEFTTQDEFEPGNIEKTTTTPVLRYVCQAYKNFSAVPSDIAKDTEYRMKVKGLTHEEREH